MSERRDAYLSTLPDADEDLRVHVEEGDEGEDAGGEGGMPGQGQRVPEDERRVLPATIRRIRFQIIISFFRENQF
jgi:hypothetical protein